MLTGDTRIRSRGFITGSKGDLGFSLKEGTMKTKPKDYLRSVQLNYQCFLCPLQLPVEV